MRRLIHLLTFLLYLSAPSFAQQYYVQGNRPYIILPNDPATSDTGVYYDEVDQSSEFNARSGISASSEEASSESTEDSKLTNLTSKIPPNFTEEVNRNRRFPPRRSEPLKADPASIEVEEDDVESGRGLSRFLWPFSVSMSKGVGVSTGHDDHGGHHGQHGPPRHHGPSHHHHHHGHGPIHHGHGHGHGHGHHGEGHGLEYEKIKLKYEIYKLKAKKKIAILQNKIELKKILSLILQQKIKALEWIS